MATWRIPAKAHIRAGVVDVFVCYSFRFLIDPASRTGHCGGYLEMHGWARAGISLKTIFRAATLDNARAFGLDDQLGTIEAGKRADLLLLTDNPLVDISAYDTIKTVIIGGRLIDRQALSATRPMRK
jgi:imidazolonepropionase-like amidohydrolase